MRGMMELISGEYEMRPTKPREEFAQWLERFHSGLAERLHNGQPVLDMIPE